MTHRSCLQKTFVMDDKPKDEPEAYHIVMCLVNDILTNVCDKQELEFFDLSKINVNESNESPSSEEFQASNDSSSSSDLGRIYRVRNDDLEEEDDTDYQNIFYSSEDLILKFIELDEQNHDDVKMIKDGEALTYSDEGGNKITNTNDLQVQKHLLKFELSKQLFEEVGTEERTNESEPSYEENRERKRKMNEDLLSKLFDYDQHQIDNIATGESRASQTLNQHSLLKFEQVLCAKKSRFSCYEDICFDQRPHINLVRSFSQPNFESIAEEDLIHSSDNSEDSGKLRPIFSTSLAPSVGVSSASQTDITALAYPDKKDPNCSETSKSSVKIKEHNKKGFLARAYSIDFERNSSVGNMQRSFSNLDKPCSKSVSFQFNENVAETNHTINTR